MTTSEEYDLNTKEGGARFIHRIIEKESSSGPHKLTVDEERILEAEGEGRHPNGTMVSIAKSLLRIDDSLRQLIEQLRLLNNQTYDRDHSGETT
ncbi:MAG: hypothetical protein ACLP5V_03795 [Candidatus Bathyarchaeia archaeon]